MPNANQWLGVDEKRPKSCLIKLYDDNVRAFKLNDVVTFIGILELPQHSEESKDDVQMK
jgi:hypothetical protein